MKTDAPRTKAGRRYRQVEGDVYAAALDSFDRVLSLRHPGTLWIAFDPKFSIKVVFADDLGSRTSTFEVTKRGTVTAIGIFLDEELICTFPIDGASQGDNVSMDWGAMYDEIR